MIDPRVFAWSKKHITKCKCSGVGWVAVRVPMDHYLFGKAVPCCCTLEKHEQAQARQLRENSGIASELTRWTFETFDPERCKAPPHADRNEVLRTMRGIKTFCVKWANAPRGFLTLCGPVGTGKTHLAYAIAAYALSNGVAVFASTVPTMLRMWREGIKANDFDERFRNTQECPLLVLDDLGVQNNTDFAMASLYELINFRYCRQLPTVITMNKRLNESGLDRRIVSRLSEGQEQAGGLSRVLWFPADDLRPEVS